jgi:hypothetical protein
MSVILDENTNLCLSGGALGADLQWGMCAGMAGHQVIHWSFNGHKTQAPESEVVRIKHDDLIIADPFLEKANITLQRKVPYDKPWVINLLRRNYYQVANSGSVYAVSTIKKNLVQGGTAWATTMFTDLYPETESCFCFDQDQEKWFVWTPDAWVEINLPTPPRGIWAGVGTRDLNLAGKNAIRELLGYKPT